VGGWAHGCLVFVAALALYTLTAGGSLSSTDAVVTFDLTQSLVERHSLALSGNLLGSEDNRGRDGRYYSQFGIGQSLYNVPFYLVGRAAARSTSRAIGTSNTLPKAAVALGSAVAAAVAVLFIWLLALRISEDARAALLAATSAAVASPLWPYSKFGFSTALTSAVLAASAYFCWRAASGARTRAAFAAGLVMAFGWLTRHEIALMLIPFCVFLKVEGRRRGSTPREVLHQIVALLATASAGGVLWMAYNTVRFGNPTAVGYVPSFSWQGYAAFLLAPGGSVLLFCPLVLVWLWGLFQVKWSIRGAVVLLAGPLIVAYLFYGALADWPGGRSYGPRYLVPALALLAPGLALLLRSNQMSRRVAVAVIAVGAVLQLPGVLVDHSKVSLEWARGADRQAIAERNWHVASSSLMLNARAAALAIPRNIAYLTGRTQMPTVDAAGLEGDRDFGQRFAFSPDLWWLYLVYMGVLGTGSASVVAVSLAMVTIVAVSLAWKFDSIAVTVIDGHERS